jgi:hypothetical protein
VVLFISFLEFVPGVQNSALLNAKKINLNTMVIGNGLFSQSRMLHYKSNLFLAGAV